MGDVLSLIDKVQQNVEQKDAARLQQAFLKQQFTLEEFQFQLQQIKRMGSVGGLLEMIPEARSWLRRSTRRRRKKSEAVDAIVNSMTTKERRDPAILYGNRRRRIAQGSGTM